MFRILLIAVTCLLSLSACEDQRALWFIHASASYQVDSRCDGPLDEARRAALRGDADMSKINKHLIDIGCFDKFSRIIPLPSTQLSTISSSGQSAAVEKRGEENVTSFFVGEVQYIRIRNFSHAWVVTDVYSALLRRPFAKKLVIDLRENRGGVVNAALDILELFAPRKGVPLMVEYNKNGFTPFLSQIRGPFADRPVIFIVDSFTASASEMLIGGVLFMNPHSVHILGTRTYGKGVYQTLRRYQKPGEPGFLISVTSGWWYSGSIDNHFGIDGRGFEPDFPFKDIKIRDNPLDDPAILFAFALSGVGIAPDK